MLWLFGGRWGKEKHRGDTFHNEVVMERGLGGRDVRWRPVELQSMSASGSMFHKIRKFSPGF